MDREQTLRIDCPNCHSNGYIINAQGGQEMCATCSGSGMLEKNVPYKFETRGVWSKAELADAFELDPEEIKDSGHSAGDDNA